MRASRWVLESRGKEALAGFYTALFEGLHGYFGDFDGTAFGEDSAVAWGRFGGTVSDEFMGVCVEAGRRIEIPVAFVCTFRDGLLTGDTGYFDAATLSEQVGVPLEVVRPSKPGPASGGTPASSKSSSGPHRPASG